MCYEAEKWARAQTVGNSTAKAVLKELAFRRNKDNGLCCPSLKTLCQDLEIKKRDTVLAAVQRLEAAGFIQREIERAENGEILRTLYTFPTFKPEEWADKPNEETYPQKRDTVSQKSGHRIPKKGAPYPEKQDTVSRKTGDRYPKNRDVTIEIKPVTKPVTEPIDTATVPEPELALTPDEKPKTKSKRTKTTIDRPDDVGEQVWDEFLILRKQKRKTFTELALKGMRREAEAAGLSLEEAMTMCVEHGWQSFQAKYVRDQNGSNRYRSKRQPTCPGDWENEFKGVDYTRGAVMKEFTPEESARLATLAEEMNF